MRLSRRINWNLLYTFVVLAETRSLSRTAELVGRGQPAISAALKKLEEQVGCTLAERGPRFFRLTEPGSLLYREAAEICSSIDRISELLKDVGEVVTGHVSIAIANHMTSPIIDDAITEFNRRHPSASLSINVTHNREMQQALANRLIPFGIGPVFSKRPDLEYVHMFKEFCGLYCGVKHRLFGRSDLAVQDLRGEAAITYRSDTDSDTLHSITEMRRAIGFAEPIKGLSNNLEEVRRMILAGVGIGAIPVQVAARDVRDGLLWRLPPYEDVMPIDVYLIINSSVRTSRAEGVFIETLTEAIASKPLEERTYRDLMAVR
jgi:DNA-binding transcriptional LysR family regulator